MEIAVGVPPAPVEPAAASTDELICEPCEPEEAKEGAAEEAEAFFEEPTICGLWGCVLSRTHSGLCVVPPLAKRGTMFEKMRGGEAPQTTVLIEKNDTTPKLTSKQD